METHPVKEDPNIILIEDNYDDAALTMRAFKEKKLDKHITLLRDGEQAIDFFFNHKEFNGEYFSLKKTTLILLDLNLPKVDGKEVLQKLKASQQTKEIPVVVLTGSDDDPSIDECRKLGANNYIVKPVTLEGFIKVVNNLGFYWSDSFRF